MESLIYTIMTTASHILKNQEVIANNLANISTPGFKSTLVSKIISSYKEHNTDNFGDKNKFTNQNMVYQYYFDKKQGSFKRTNQPLDLAIINNNGWFITKLNKNKLAYTKNGHLKINSKGYLTIQNHELLGQNGPIFIPNNKTISISSNGNVNLTDDKIINELIDKIKLAKIDSSNLKYNSNGFYLLNEKVPLNSIQDIQHDLKVISGVLEDSNVNVEENVVKMISDTRMFDMQMKILSNYNENIQLANKFLSITS